MGSVIGASFVVQLGSMLDAKRVRAKPLIVGQFGLAQNFDAEPRPLPRILDPEIHLIAVAAAECPVRRDRRMVHAAAQRRRATIGRVVRRSPHPLGERIEQRNVDRGALAGGRSGEERVG